VESAFGLFFFRSIKTLLIALVKKDVLVVGVFTAPTIRENRAAVPIAFQKSIIVGSASAVIVMVADRG
jgi:hypothetical protein